MIQAKRFWSAMAAGGAIVAAYGAEAAAISADPAALSEADRGAIMRAAGYRLTRGQWLQSCDSPREAWEGEITRVSDMNGDGRPEAVVEGGNTHCFGMVGSAFILLTSTPAGWRPLYQGPGIPDFYPRPGIAFPDLEIGGPGTHCFPFLRWNGNEYASGGTSVGGRICDLRVMSAAMPLPIGYYAQEPMACHELSETNPAMIGYLGRDRFVQVTSGRFVSFRRTGTDQYSQTETFPSEEGGPGDTQSSQFTVNSDSSFRLHGREDWTHCPLDRVPRAARFIDSTEYRNDPRIRPVRGNAASPPPAPPARRLKQGPGR